MRAAGGQAGSGAVFSRLGLLLEHCSFIFFNMSNPRTYDVFLRSALCKTKFAPHNDAEWDDVLAEISHIRPIRATDYNC